MLKKLQRVIEQIEIEIEEAEEEPNDPDYNAGLYFAYTNVLSMLAREGLYDVSD